MPTVTYHTTFHYQSKRCILTSCVSAVRIKAPDQPNFLTVGEACEVYGFSRRQRWQIGQRASGPCCYFRPRPLARCCPPCSGHFAGRAPPVAPPARFEPHDKTTAQSTRPLSISRQAAHRHAGSGLVRVRSSDRNRVAHSRRLRQCGPLHIRPAGRFLCQSVSSRHQLRHKLTVSSGRLADSAELLTVQCSGPEWLCHDRGAESLREQQPIDRIRCASRI